MGTGKSNEINSKDKKNENEIQPENVVKKIKKIIIKRKIINSFIYSGMIKILIVKKIHFLQII